MNDGRERNGFAGTTGRRRRWWLLSLGMVVATVLLVAFLQSRLPVWTKAGLESAAQRIGLDVEVAPLWLGLDGGRVAVLHGTAAGSTFSVDRASAGWSLSGVLRGQLQDVTLEGVRATIDVEHFWPLRQRVTTGSEVTIVHEPRAAESLAEYSSAALSGERPALLSGESATPAAWWEFLPMEELLVPSARITARYGAAQWPFDLRLSYSTEDFKREIWLQLQGEGMDLEVSARQLSSGLSWTAQGAMDWSEPLRALAEFFPEEHPAHPRVLQRLGLRAISLSDFRTEGVLRGEAEDWEEIGLLFEGDHVELGWLGNGAADISEWIFALRGSPGRLELNTGVAVASLRHGPWAAGHFQLTMARDAEGIVRLETPRIAWRHAAGISGEMSARAFSEWPPAAPGMPSAELQMAFGQLTTPFFSLRPFRFFLNLRDAGFDGRLSALTTSDHAGWQVVNARIEGRWPNGDAGGQLSMDATLEHSRTAQALAILHGSVVELDGGGYRTAGTLRQPVGTLLATWQGEIGEAGYTSLRVAEAWDLQKILPGLLSFWPALQGWQGSGSVDWELELENGNLRLPAAELSIDMHNVSLGSPVDDWSLRDVAGRIRAEARPFPRSCGPQSLTVGALQVGPVEWENLQLQFSLPAGNRLSVHALSADWLGGKVTIEPFTFDPRAPEFSATVRFEGLDPRQARAVFANLPVGTGGRVHGSREIRYHEGKWFGERASVQLVEGETVRREIAMPAREEGFSTLSALLSAWFDPS